MFSLSNLMNRYKNWTSLPPEVLSHIFYLGTFNSEDLGEGISFPLLASHVSSTWRRVALLTPKLWTTIIITGIAPSNQIIRAGVWLQRSKACLTHIYLDFRDIHWNWDEDDHPFSWKRMEIVLSVLLPHISRWNHLEVLSDTWAPIYTLLWHCSKRTAPSLQTLSLSRCNAYFARDGETFRPVALKDPLSLFLGGAPNLKHVELAGTHVRWSSLPFSNLQTLHFKYHAREVMPTLSEFISIFAASPDLLELSILGWGPCSFTDAGIKIQDGMIALPKLRKFSFGLVDEDYGVQLFSLFSVPNLRNLELEDLGNSLDLITTRDSTRFFNKLVKRRLLNADPSMELRHLEQLHLSTIRCSVHVLIQYLTIFVNLRLVVFDNISGALLTALIAIIRTSVTIRSSLRRVEVRHVNCIEGRPWETSIAEIQSQVFPTKCIDLCRTSLVQNGIVHVRKRRRSE